MPKDDRFDPVAYNGVMVSSTFKDLVQHRKALIDAINAHRMMAVAMEDDTAKPGGDVLDSSMQMVRDAAGYVCVIANKYGQVPEDDQRNPHGLSLTELEFNEARRLDRPVLLFIMGGDHPITRGDVEQDPDRAKKLAAFRESAMRLGPDSNVHRVYQEFNSLQQFEVKAMQALAGLRQHLEKTRAVQVEAVPVVQETTRIAIPAPPALYAEPPYIGSHQFVGREAQLGTLSDWASAADPHPVLLFDAIGGTGKSMLTWEWTTKHATTARKEWAGRFWYSFYERGAIMADFCRRALAYMTRRPFEDFAKKKTLELSALLLQQLRARPWMLVLDGLERVLVAYHRIDAAQVADEDAGQSDEIAKRDPRAAIAPEDDELLRSLSSAAPSKLLITSRLIPQILLNRSGQPIPGVRHERLPGLRPADAETLFRACGITGTPEEMQKYLQTHCDCHPLVTGVLAGLINDYFPDRGNFDAWVDDANGGAALNLADLDLGQKRNHILRAAFDALPEHGRQLVSILALLSESVDYGTLTALDPYATPESELGAQRRFSASGPRREELTETVRDLERRGLLQYDPQARRYDLHPVVRGVAAGRLVHEERASYGRRVVDYFSRQRHNPYEQAETLDDLRDGLHVIRTLIQMGQYREAAHTLIGDLSIALSVNLESYSTLLSLLRPFFFSGWDNLPANIDLAAASELTTLAGVALNAAGEYEEALVVHGCSLRADLANDDWSSAWVKVSNVAVILGARNRLAACERWLFLADKMASLLKYSDYIFAARIDLFNYFTSIGRTRAAQQIWDLLDPMGRDWERRIYRPGTAEYLFVRSRFLQGRLTEEILTAAEALAQRSKARGLIRELHSLRGQWRLENLQWELAASSLREATRMAREVGQMDAESETQLALANLHLRRLPDARHEAERLSTAKHVSSIDIAALWLAIGDDEEAKKYAIEAYRWAWADGEPYVRRYKLNQARTLLDQLGVEIPSLPPYQAAKDKKLPWEDEVVAAIEELQKRKRKETRTKQQAKKKKTANTAPER